MSLLGMYRKQPVEVEVYGIQFAQDMTTTDQITTAWQMVSREFSPAWDRLVMAVPYTALLTDDDRMIVTTSDVTLPVGVTEGFRLNVANKSQTTGILVGAFSVPARGATVVTYTNGVWVEEIKTTSVLVDAVQDQRVRTWVANGVDMQVYTVQVTVVTTEGRTMQDEFTVEIEET